MHQDNIDVRNPEELLEEQEWAEGSIDTSYMFDDFISVRELAQILSESTVVNIGKILQGYADVLPDKASDGIGKMLAAKVYNATPDELQGICDEAKRQGVWIGQVRGAVMERNNKHARNVWKCENLPSLDLLLTSIANTTDQRLPAPVYHTLGMVLERFVKSADTVTQIDNIQEVASKWRKLGQIRKLVMEKDRALNRSIERYKKTYGYRVRSGSRHMIIESGARVLRMVESGEWEFED